MQLYARISNLWDLKKVCSGEIDLKTGELKKQKKHLYVVVLVGSKFSLDHVLELIYPSLAAIGCHAKKKDIDIDAHESLSLYAFVVSLTTKLTKDLERHEEWMQANARLQIPVSFRSAKPAESEPEGSVSRNFGEIPVVFSSS
jgi:hypothetical protein